MFYDFNRHKKLAASENNAPESRPLRYGLQNLAARIPEKIKMPVLVLLISLAGLGFLRLIIDGSHSGPDTGFPNRSIPEVLPEKSSTF